MAFLMFANVGGIGGWLTLACRARGCGLALEAMDRVGMLFTAD